MNVAPLPPEVVTLLDKLNAPPRLIAHLTLVHDVARTLTTRLSGLAPGAHRGDARSFDTVVTLGGGGSWSCRRISDLRQARRWMAPPRRGTRGCSRYRRASGRVAPARIRGCQPPPH